MPEFHDPWAVIKRIRAATASVSDPDDLKIVQEYLQELERKALLLSDGDAGDFAHFPQKRTPTLAHSSQSIGSKSISSAVLVDRVESRSPAG